MSGLSEQQITDTLRRFQQWLRQVAAELETCGGDEASGNGATEAALAGASQPGFIQLVEQFTALRHECKLQTKSVRTLSEQTEAAVTTLKDALARLQAAEAAQATNAQRTAQPLVEALMEVDEAVQRGRVAINIARQRVLEDLAGQVRAELEELRRRQPAWRRWLCRDWYAAATELLIQRTALLYRDIFDSLVEGYGLVLNRLQRAMAKAQLYRIECVGKSVDPHTMTVVEAVADPLRPPGMVIEEVRPGYYWRDQVLRCAEVRAVGGKIC
jgi:molecular chaperone GrpE